MSKESTKAAFQKAFSDHMLLNLSPEEEAELTVYRKPEERLRKAEEAAESDTPPSTTA